MRLALCNEVLRERDFAAQCAFAAAVGYDGLEVAPFTLADDPLALSTARIAAVRSAAADAGVAITGLHWLLVKPDGLSITSPDAAVRARTIDAIRRIVDLCAALGGRYLVHGSPAQRRTPPGVDRATARAWIAEALAAAAHAAQQAGVTYLLEPLPARRDRPGQHARRGRRAGARSRLACARDDARREVRGAHRNRERARPPRPLAAGRRDPPRAAERPQSPRARPGQRPHRAHRRGADRRRLRGDIAIEPFEYVPDGPACAARAAGYVRGLLEALSPSR